jgi:hypothetical protein
MDEFIMLGNDMYNENNYIILFLWGFWLHCDNNGSMRER